MKTRPQIFWISYGVLMCLVCIPLGILCYRCHRAYADVRTQLQQSERVYERLTSATPFPSAKNVKIVQGDLERARRFYQDLRDLLCRGAIRPEGLARDLFGERLLVTRDRLLAAAADQGVQLPDRFFFGFQRYADGSLPDADQIPRLTVQLKCIEELATMLIDGGADAIRELRREVFETDPPPARSGGRGRAAPRPSPATPSPNGADEDDRPFKIESLEVSFIARDQQVWEILDRLATGSIFAVPTSIELRALPAPDGAPPTPEQFIDRISAGPSEPADARPDGADGVRPDSGSNRPAERSRQAEAEAVLRAVPHDERVIAGRRERVRVKLALDVYHFCSEASAADAEGPSMGSGTS